MMQKHECVPTHALTPTHAHAHTHLALHDRDVAVGCVAEEDQSLARVLRILRVHKMLMRTEVEGVWSIKKKDVNVNRG